MTSTLPSLTCPAPTSKAITSVCVFCGSGDGGNPEYREQATGMTLQPILSQTPSVTHSNE